MSGFTTRPEIRGSFGVVASTHWIASQAAMGVLERGGNAFDAAAAGAFVLQVVEPHLNGPGGEAPILLWSEKERRLRALCGQGPAPALAEPQLFRRMGLDLVPGIGLMPATVPGAFGAWATLLRDYGSWELADVLRPAIEYAREGFPLVPRIVEAIVAVRPLFESEWKESAAVWLPGGRVPRPFDSFANPRLADTYQHLLAESAKSSDDRVGQIDAAMKLWYQGFVARAIDAYYTKTKARDTTGERNAGLLRYEDMEQWRPGYEEPVTYDFRDWTIAKCGPWSQGPVFLQQLALLDRFELETLTPTGPEFVHVVSEATKLAMADRLAWYGDPNFVEVPLKDLQSATYNDGRLGLIDRLASTELRPGSPGGRTPRLPDLNATKRTLAAADTRFGVGEPTFAALTESDLMVGDTCHIDVIDRFGNMVSATPSGGWLSSSPAIPELGFSINTRLQMTWLDDGVPGQLAPGKRPCTTLSPSMALKDGEPALAFGTPGGDQQDQWSLVFFLRHALHGMNLQEAIDAPAWHIDHYPASFWPRATTLNRLTLESRFPADTIAALKGAGHDVQVGEPWSEGRMSACARERDQRGRWTLKAAANPRRMQGYAVGR